MANVPGGTNGFYSTATQPIASVNTGYYGHIQTPPPAGSAGAGGSTLATDPTSAPAAPSGSAGDTSYNNSTNADTLKDASNPVYGNPYDQVSPYSGSFYSGNGTYGALGTNAPTGGIGNVSGGSPTTTGAPTTGSADPNAGGGGTPSPGVLSGPGYGEDWYAQHGNDLGGKTNTQSIYDQGVSATNPYYQHAMDETNKAINLASAARGTGNSGAALAEIGTADATLLGQQALDQSHLAASADAANNSQFTTESNAANNAESQTNNRINGATSAYTNLSNDQAQTVDKFYQMATSGQLTGDMASIEAQLAASGVDAATAQAIANDLLTAAGIATKATSGK